MKFFLALASAAAMAQAPAPLPIVPTVPPAAQAQQAPAAAPAVPAAPTPAERARFNLVVMTEKGGQHDLTPMAGAFATTYAFVTVLFYADFPDKTAQVHIQDPLPTFYVQSDVDPRGRVFLVKAEQTKKGRSVKLGKSGFGSVSGMMIPDPDWTFEFTYKKTSQENVWEITPKAPLVKGEYGIYMGVLGNTSAPTPGGGGNLFDFTEE